MPKRAFLTPQPHCLYSLPMRRLLCIFLMLWFPFQMSWAAVASYCQHETDPAAQRHFGHHEHVHVDSADGERHGGGDKKASIDNDNDCAVCHLHLAAPVSAATPMAAGSSSEWGSAPVPVHASNIPRGPERPDIALAA